MNEQDKPDAPDQAASLIARADAPIRSLEEDQLGRGEFARALAAEVLAAPASRGYVMGLTGAWGSGKTSVLNMVAQAIADKAIVIHFNPWMFSGTEALVAAFFAEIGKQLEKKEAKLKAIAGKLAAYGQVLSPFAALAGAGAAADGTVRLLQAAAAPPSVFERHTELRTLLDGLDRRVVVLVDDVDRLRPQEVLDIVRLVRLVGDFPNTLYLLAFDRNRVEQCLGEGDLARGRAYLEKIVQVTHDVPAPRQPDVAAMFSEGLATIVGSLTTGPFDTEDWQNIFTFVIRPLLATPRHVQRLLGALSMTMRMVGDEVALADLVGIEAVRVLDPALFEAAVSAAEHLREKSGPSAAGYQHGRSAVETPVGPLFAASPEHAASVCRWLFPAACRFYENRSYGSERTWRLKRKLASGSVFRFYLERQLPAGVAPARVVDEALDRLSDRDRLGELLADCGPEELMDLIERMNPAIEQLPVAAEIDQDPAWTAAPVLLDLLPRLPEGRAAFTPRGSMVVMRAVLRLLRRIDEQQRDAAVQAVFEATGTLSGRLVLLWVAGHRQGVGSALVSASLASELEQRLRHQLMNLTPVQFATQDRIGRLAAVMAETDEGKAALCTFAGDDLVVLSLLADCLGEAHSQTIGAAAVEVTAVLPWAELEDWFGPQDLARRVIEVLEAATAGCLATNEVERAALNLAAMYARGDRPLTPWERMTRKISSADGLTGDGEVIAVQRGGSAAEDAEEVDP